MSTDTQPAAPSAALPQRYAVLDGVRGLTALAVMIHHFTQRGGGWVIFSSAQYAVDLFFCISGFVIARAYGAKLAAGGMSLGRFFRRRFARLYPAYLIGLLLGVAGLSLKYLNGLTSYEPINIATAFALNALYLPYISDQTVQIFDHTLQGVVFPLNGPAWSLFFGFVANIVYCLVVRRGGSWRAHLLVTLLAGLGFTVAVKLFGEGPGWGTENFIGGFPRVLYAFFAGVLVYEFRDRLAFLARVPATLLFLLLAATLLVPEFRLHTYYWFVCAVVLSPLIVACAAASKARLKPWLEKLAHYLGALSYPVYCIHAPLISLTSTLFADSPWQVWGTWGGIATTLVLAHGVTKLVEAPLQRYLAARKAGEKGTA